MKVEETHLNITGILKLGNGGYQVTVSILWFAIHLAHVYRRFKLKIARDNSIYNCN